ncbi:putative zingipain [Helianthus annuus]|uniref:Zingipain n=2 Tax=Helianthus annuus TaxID=4232 RepID=A0A9K3IBH4_HELAN|nr:putative zingipain [Helianthus annuus]KAJ0552167.1 putative zingipain [Helianthus annuus]KAJ0717871.1 putative zingipain [Helianthus annuus]
MSKWLKLCGICNKRKSNAKLIKLGSRISIPREQDFRQHGALPEVQDQGHMPTCWAFGPLAAIEAAYQLITGKLLKFSEQEIVNHYWSAASKREKRLMRNIGYYSELTFEYLISKGKISLAADYRYKTAFGKCKRLDARKLVDPLVRGYIQVPNDEVALQIAVATQPVTVALEIDEVYNNYNPEVYSYIS